VDVQVLVFGGPGKESQGKLLRVAVRKGEGDLNHPWDVKVFQGKIVVTTHTDQPEDNDSAVNVYDARSGRLLCSCKSPFLDHPNMIALEGEQFRRRSTST
jgi:hypothetical protein